jgi:phosphatidylinositol glycan class B
MVSERTPSLSRREASAWLGAALLLAWTVRVVLSLRSGIVHPDEIFQMEEPAHRLAFGYGVISWEWRDGIRSWVFPYLFSLLMRGFGPSAGSAGYVFAIKLLLSTASLSVVLTGYYWVRRISGEVAALVAAFACAIWYQLAIYASHPLSEVLSTNFLLPGLYLQCFNDGQRARLTTGTLLTGIAACARIQLLPIVLLATVLFCTDRRPRTWAYLAAAIMTPLCLYGLVDWLTWGHPFQSMWKYVLVNMTVSKRFGVEPWWWYLRDLAERLNILLLAAVLAVRRLPKVALIVAATIALFSVIPHKEERFLYPIWPLIIVMASVGLYSLLQSQRLHAPLRLRAALTPVAAAAIITGISFLSALRFHFWAGSADTIRLFDLLSRDRSVCGVELIDIPWVNSGGYTHLHRDIPIGISDLMIRGAGIANNVLVTTRANLSLIDPSYTRLACSGTWAVCAYKRPGRCWPADNGINSYLARNQE